MILFIFVCFQNSTKEKHKHLDSLHNFVSHATRELIWLNEKEEEEVAFDWSERNSSISRKKDYHAVSPSVFEEPLFLSCLFLSFLGTWSTSVT